MTNERIIALAATLALNLPSLGLGAPRQVDEEGSPTANVKVRTHRVLQDADLETQEVDSSLRAPYFAADGRRGAAAAYKAAKSVADRICKIAQYDSAHQYRMYQPEGRSIGESSPYIVIDEQNNQQVIDKANRSKWKLNDPREVILMHIMPFAPPPPLVATIYVAHWQFRDIECVR